MLRNMLHNMSRATRATRHESVGFVPQMCKHVLSKTAYFIRAYSTRVSKRELQNTTFDFTFGPAQFKNTCFRSWRRNVALTCPPEMRIFGP